MKNRDFVSEYTRHLGDTEKRERSNTSILFRRGVLYSYGEHYPLLFKVGQYIFRNVRGYSSTTGKHISHCSRDFDVVLDPSRSGYPNFDKETVIKCLKAEQKDIQERNANLSDRAWRQRERLEERYLEIGVALKTIS